jgi:ribulose-phosphate 3-epimerase
MSKVEIVPAILEEDILTIEERIKMVAGSVSLVQVDICDGVFVPSKTYGAAGTHAEFEGLRVLAEAHGVKTELDMMVQLGASGTESYNSWKETLLSSGAERIILHMGATPDWRDITEALHGAGIRVGLAVHIGTNLEDVYTLLDTYTFTFVQVMGIARVGYGGQPFDTEALVLIAALRKQYPEMTIAVDGGVNNDTALLLRAAGATQLAAGSTIFKSSNPQAAIENLQGE